MPEEFFVLIVFIRGIKLNEVKNFQENLINPDKVICKIVNKFKRPGTVYDKVRRKG